MKNMISNISVGVGIFLIGLGVGIIYKGDSVPDVTEVPSVIVETLSSQTDTTPNHGDLRFFIEDDKIILKSYAGFYRFGLDSPATFEIWRTEEEFDSMSEANKRSIETAKKIVRLEDEKETEKRVQKYNDSFWQNIK